MKDYEDKQFFFRRTYTDESYTIRPGVCIRKVNKINFVWPSSIAVCSWTLQELGTFSLLRLKEANTSRINYLNEWRIVIYGKNCKPAFVKGLLKAYIVKGRSRDFYLNKHLIFPNALNFTSIKSVSVKLEVMCVIQWG